MQNRSLAVSLMVAFVVALVLVWSAPPAQAQTESPSIFSLDRLSIGVGADKEVALKFEKDSDSYSGVVALAYNILSPKPGTSGPRVSLAAKVAQPFNTDLKMSFTVGLRYTVKKGGS